MIEKKKKEYVNKITCSFILAADGIRDTLLERYPTHKTSSRYLETITKRCVYVIIIYLTAVAASFNVRKQKKKCKKENADTENISPKSTKHKHNMSNVHRHNIRIYGGVCVQSVNYTQTRRSIILLMYGVCIKTG